MAPFFQMTLVLQISQTEWYRGCGGPSDRASSSAGRREPGIEPALPHTPPPQTTALGMGLIALGVPHAPVRRLSWGQLSSASACRVFLALSSCRVASSQRGDSSSSAGHLGHECQVTGLPTGLATLQD